MFIVAVGHTMARANILLWELSLFQFPDGGWGAVGPILANNNRHYLVANRLII